MNTKKIKIVFTLSSMFLYLLILPSCKVYKSTDTKLMKINGAGVIQRPVVVDLLVAEKKVTGHATNESGKKLDITKNEAVSEALKTVQGDV